ncbi:helix-turn-helix domain-containing protein [Rhizobium sp. 768_B6_N1_8]|uniref:helix-turn-helix domain-containing protein n=1 Tax=unclassified Rhizobium TaxID=2613769 RepID=UPI003F2472AC
MIEPERHNSSRAWSWRHAVSMSGLQPITRLVLHTLGLKMDETGGSCYPSVADLVSMTGLDKKTVMKHLDIAEEKGWIEITEHGFRGQKWKRAEYVARWPGRDLTGAVAVATDEEGGGAVPPPSEAKVVEMVPEGGGNGSQKVVEQLHQDKNLPANSSTHLPAAGAAEGVIGKADRKKIEAAFVLWFASWKKGDIDFARNAWFALSAEERAECIERTPDYLRWAKPSDIMAAAVYLKQRHWRDIPAEFLERERMVVHNPFSRAWTALALFELLKPVATAMPAPSRFQQMQIDQGGAVGAVIVRERQQTYGWPKVATMFQRAQMAQGMTVPASLVLISEGFTRVRRGSADEAAWKAAFDRRNWPWLPVTGHEWFFFPAGEPEEALASFGEAIARERGDDDAA